MDKYENIVPFDTKNAKSPRFNFDDFINAFVTCFTILIGEGWE